MDFIRRRIASAGFEAGSSLNTGLYSAWKFEESTGTRVDDFGNLDMDNLSSVPGARTGQVGNALDCLPSAVYSSTNVNGICDGGADWTLGFWVLFDATGSGMFVASVWEGNGSKSWALEKDSGDDMKIYNSSNGTATTGSTVLTTPTISTATWYHIVLRFDSGAGDLECFFNGSSLGSRTETYYSGVAGGLGFGGLGNSASLNGGVDLGFLWTRQLTDAEITELYGSIKNQPF